MVALLAVAVTACSSSDDDAGTSSTSGASESTEQTANEAMDAETIVDVASANPDFSTLVSAVQQADLVETLQGEGPFTVFAPTNDAFAKIPTDQLERDPRRQGRSSRRSSRTTWSPSKVMAADLQPEQSVATVQGKNVDIKVTDTGATINGCNIVKTDVAASNGVIHVIDCVLVPPA